MDSGTDFPDAGFLESTKTTKDSVLTYDHIHNDEPESEQHSKEPCQPGWVYGSIDPETRHAVWRDLSTPVMDQGESVYDITFVTNWIKNFEEEKDTYIHEYGYDAYMRQYLVSEENLSDGEEECHDDGGDEYDECTDDEY